MFLKSTNSRGDFSCAPGTLSSGGLKQQMLYQIHQTPSLFERKICTLVCAMRKQMSNVNIR